MAGFRHLWLKADIGPWVDAIVSGGKQIGGTDVMTTLPPFQATSNSGVVREVR